jgi:hypothetical protein
VYESKLKETIEELSSLQLINKLLQNELLSIRPTWEPNLRPNVNHDATETTHSNVGDNNCEWSSVTRRTRWKKSNTNNISVHLKSARYTNHLAQAIPLNLNRYDILTTLHDDSVNPYPTSSGRRSISKENKVITSMVNKIKEKHNIVIIGDSHASGAASQLQDNLNADFTVTSTVKPGAPMNAITNTADEAVQSLTGEDLIIIWGGSNDISRNNSKLALNEVHNFVINNPDSNIVLISAPHRHDLIPASCVNAEIVKFKRQIKRIAKLYSHMHLLEPNLDRSHFTAHGMHLNYKGKAQSAINLAELVKKIYKEQLVPIATPWGAPPNNQPLSPEEQDVDPISSPARSAHQDNLRDPPQESISHLNMLTRGDEIEADGRNPEDSAPTRPVQQSEEVIVALSHDANQAIANEQGVVLDPSHSVTVCENGDMKAPTVTPFLEELRVSKRKKKPPTTKNEDFLW